MPILQAWPNTVNERMQRINCLTTGLSMDMDSWRLLVGRKWDRPDEKIIIIRSSLKRDPTG